MRRIVIPLVCMFVVMVSIPARAQIADANELPLYREFRVLSGLPWKEAGTTRKTVLERIFREPHALVRREVLREYLQTVLPVEEFPAAFDECIALEQADFPGAVAELVMRAWAERDPDAALQRCRTLFDLVIEGASLDFNTWSRGAEGSAIDWCIFESPADGKQVGAPQYLQCLAHLGHPAPEGNARVD